MSHRCYAAGVKTLNGSTPINPTAWCACGWEREFTDWNEAATACKNHRGTPPDNNRSETPEQPVMPSAVSNNKSGNDPS